MSTNKTQMRLPLDSDGFLRRECPSCERELKWMYSPASGTEAAPPPENGYFCPYCGEQAMADQWITKAQGQLARETAMADLVHPLLKDFKEDVERGIRPGGPVSLKVTLSEPKQPQPLTEPEDMRRVDFSCHPTEPVKVLDDWDGPVHCIVCGTG